MESEELSRKIEETVIDTLRTADLETITEYNVRTIAAERLGIDFSDLDRKWLVRRAVESFLLSSPAEEKVREETKEVVEEQQHIQPGEASDDCGREICKLSENRNISILTFGENNLVSIRDCYQKDGKQLQSETGITLTARQWSAFKDSVPSIQEAITKMESKIRSKGVRIHTDTAKPSSSASVFQEPDTSNPRANFQENTSFPIEPQRLTGKNYYSWACQMEFFLTQLKIGYVLKDPCPYVPQEAQKWAYDDYMCRRTILNLLSDNLFDQCSKKDYTSAKELWEALRLIFNEDLGAKRSHVHHYLHFQMVDGISILDQVQILNNMADSVMASGMWFDENFHVSTIVSKLPHSWKDVRAKLMREEVLNFAKLMHYLRLEEDFRNRPKEGEVPSQGRIRKFDFRGKVNGR